MYLKQHNQHIVMFQSSQNMAVGLEPWAVDSECADLQTELARMAVV